MVLEAKVSFSLNVREFDAIGHTNEQFKVVNGTSIIVKLESDSTLPGNFGVQVKTGSTAIEKFKRSGKYNEKTEIIDITGWHK